MDAGNSRVRGVEKRARGPRVKVLYEIEGLEYGAEYNMVCCGK